MQAWIFWILLIGLGGLTALPSVEFAQGAKTPFSISISAPEPSVRVGSAIRINATITNTTSEDAWISMTTGSRGEFDFTIDVNDGTGHVPVETEYFRAIKGKHGTSGPQLVVTYGGGPRLVKPGGSLTTAIQLDKLYDMSKPEKYAIQVGRPDEVSKETVKSNKITVTVTP